MTKQLRRRSARGISLVETLVSASILLVAVLGTSRSVAGSMTLTKSNRDIVNATQAARAVLEDMQDAGVTRAFRLYNTAASDDPDGAGTGPGAAFDVAGLLPVTGDADGRVGQVLLPARSAAPTLISEAADAFLPGMPRDLDLDGNAAETDVTSTAKMLPAVVVVEWQTSSGPKRLEFPTLLVRP